MMTGRLQRIREWSPLLPLILLLGATYWLNQQVQPMPGKTDEQQRHDPDFIITRPVATTLDGRGIPHFILAANEMRHYPDDDSTHLTEPRLSTLYSDQPPVYTSSMRGEVSSKGTDISLHDNVYIVRGADDTRSEMTLATSYLHVVPDKDIMDTDRPVTMTDAHNVIHATGMEFDNKARVMKLLAQVRSQHEIVRH